jgi:hypothetical protein
MVIGPGPQGLQPDFNGNTVSGPTIIASAASNEGDTVVLWGTIQKDGYPMDGLIWADLLQAGGVKRGLIIHDRDFYWSVSSDRPVEGSGNTVTDLPEYDVWQVFASVQEAQGYIGQSVESPVTWLSESTEWNEMFWRWEELVEAAGTSDDLSQSSCLANSSSLVVNETGLFALEKYPGYWTGHEAGKDGGYASYGTLWIIGALSGCTFNECNDVGNEHASCGSKVCADVETVSGTDKCFEGDCRCFRDESKLYNELDCNRSVEACENVGSQGTESGAAEYIAPF